MRTRPPIAEVRRIYEESNTIAVVGASPDTSKRAYVVPNYLQEQGYRIIPVNPNRDEVFGEKAYPTLLDIPEPVDVVDVFRPAAEAPGLAEQAVEIGARVFWLQLGIVSEAAGHIAVEGGIAFVEDHCMGQMHAMLGLGPGPPHPG
ncbi:MAG: CoA-binding protein [Acidimicrobiia bacterium]